MNSHAKLRHLEGDYIIILTYLVNQHTPPYAWTPRSHIQEEVEDY